ncbi:MAG TPA: hypothetical protein VF530_22330 [Planctomycetota bacterium]
MSVKQRPGSGGGRSGFLPACLVAGLSLGTGGIAAGPGAGEEVPSVQVVRVPHGGYQPVAALDEQGVIHLVVHVGAAELGDLAYLRSADGGKTFAAPLTITSEATRACAFGAVRGAQLALGRGGRVHVAWNGPAGKDGVPAPMLYTRLDESGTRFEPPRDVITRHHGLDGGGALVADAAGRVWVAWHAPETPGGDESTRRVFVARSEDDGRTFAPETAISAEGSGVCPCCGIAAFVRGEGLGIVYRTASKGENRDTLFCQMAPGMAGYQRLDRWKSPACVMSTYATAASPRGTLVALESQGAVRFTLPGEGAPPACTTAPGDSPARKHPVIACNAAGTVLLAWLSGSDSARGGVLEWQLFDAERRPLAGSTGSVEEVPVWDRPAAVARADGSFVLFY